MYDDVGYFLEMSEKPESLVWGEVSNYLRLLSLICSKLLKYDALPFFCQKSRISTRLLAGSERKRKELFTLCSTMNVTLGRRYFCHLQCKQINGNSSVQLLETFVSDLLKAPQIQCCPPIFLPKKTYIDKTVGWIWEKKKRAFHTIAQWMSH